MLLKQETLKGIRDGQITLAFRVWKAPRVKAGSTMLTPVGQLGVDRVDRVRPEDITEHEARAAGWEGRDGLLADIRRRSGHTYRIRLRWLGADPRDALRARVPDSDEIAAIRTRLDNMDRRSRDGPWTTRVLRLIRDHPETLAAALAEKDNMEKAVFKPRVRRLKALGLTESLKVGYRLSPRGEAVLGPGKK